MSRIVMPLDINVKNRCPICSKEAIGRGKQKDDYIYWGDNAEVLCSICKRLICPIHIYTEKKICSDCNGK